MELIFLLILEFTKHKNNKKKQVSKFNKILAFIIVIKRKNLNSFLLKTSFEKMAQDFSISPNTLKLYLRLACEQGYLVKEKTGYRAIDFFTIVKIFCKKHGKQLSHHNLLHKRELNFKKVLQEFEVALLHDTCFEPQFKHVNMYQMNPNALKKASENLYIADNNLDTRSAVTTSVRQIVEKLGIGHAKASKLLKSGGKLFKPQINRLIFPGCSKQNFERLRQMYPKAYVVMCHNQNTIKVCFGTTVQCSRQKKTYRRFGVDMNIQKQVLMAERLLRGREANKLDNFTGFNQGQIESLMSKSKTGTKNEYFKDLLAKRSKGLSGVILA